MGWFIRGMVARRHLYSGVGCAHRVGAPGFFFFAQELAKKDAADEARQRMLAEANEAGGEVTPASKGLASTPGTSPKACAPTADSSEDENKPQG